MPRPLEPNLRRWAFRPDARDPERRTEELLRAPGEPSYGILEVDSTEARQFTADDVDFLRTYANLIAAAVQRFRTLSELRDRAAEKQRLLFRLPAAAAPE